MLVIEPYCPKSWFTDLGRAKLVADLIPRLPDVHEKLFITLTVNPQLFENSEVAFEKARDRIRRIMHRLRRGVDWKGSTYKLDGAYFTKVEFHQNGWAHFHIIFKKRRYLPGELLNSLWDYGRTNVKRITNSEFHYLLTYVTKDCDLPDWIKSRKRLRVIQATKGFYSKSSEEPKRKKKIKKIEAIQSRASYTIGERHERLKRTAQIVNIDVYGIRSGHQQILLQAEYWTLLESFIIGLVRTDKYLGRGRIKLKNQNEIEIWKNKKIPTN